MAKRFPVLYPMPVDEKQYKQYLKLALDPIEKKEYTVKCQENVPLVHPRPCKSHKELNQPDPQCTDCTRYDISMIQKTIANLIAWGFLETDKSENDDDTYVRLPPHSAEFLAGEMQDEFSELVQRSLEYAWSRPTGDQVALEAVFDVLDKIPKHSEDWITQKQLSRELDMANDQINGYDFNIASGGSQRTLRELLKLLSFAGLVRKDPRGRVRLSSDTKRIKSVRSGFEDLCVLKVAEDAIDILGPTHPAFSTDFKMALSKYYIYRHCRGIGKQRRLISILRKSIEKTHDKLLEYYQKEAEKAGKRAGRGKTLANTGRNYRRAVARRIANQHGIPVSKDDEDYMALVKLHVPSIESLKDCDTLEDVRKAVKISKGRFDRSVLDEIRHTGRQFRLPDAFRFFSDWQREATEKWLSHSPSGDHEKYTGIVSAVTGSGKTVMGMLAIQEYVEAYPEACISIIVPTKVLMYQWVTELAKLLGMSSKEIGLRGDGFKDSFSGGKRVVVSIVNSAIRDDHLRKDVEALPGGTEHMLIADECHRYGGEEFRRVFDCRMDARLGLSATPPAKEEVAKDQPQENEKQSDSDIILEALGGSRPFYHMNYEKARNENLICDFKIKYVGVHLTAMERIVYDRFTKSISKVLEKIRMVYGHRIDAMKADSLDQKLQTILKHDEYPDPSIGKYFRLTKERRDIIYDSRNRKMCYNKLLREGIESGRKIMIFHERIKQLEDVVAPVYRRRPDLYGMANKDLDEKEREVNKALEEWLSKRRFRPVMYHSLQKPKWNRWSMEWFRRDVANTMLSVKALVEGVDVPSADLGIVRVSSSSVRQRIQTIGRVLRRGRGSDKSAEIYVIFVLDSVDTNIFRAYNWNDELGSSAIEYYIWDDATQELKPRPREELPIPEEYEDTRPPIEVDVSGLEPGDSYPGRVAGDLYHATASGRTYRRTRNGRVYLENKAMIAAGAMVLRLKRGGKLYVTPQGNLVTRTMDRGAIFLGTVDVENLRREIREKLDRNDKRGRKSREYGKVPSFDELFGDA